MSTSYLSKGALGAGVGLLIYVGESFNRSQKIHSPVAVRLGLTYMLTNHGFRFDVGWFLLSISPYQWALTGIALAVSLSVMGAAL